MLTIILQQGEKNNDNIALQHSVKRRDQESAPKENIAQEKEKDLSLLGVNKNNRSSKSQNIFENRQTMNEDFSTSNKENAHNHLKMSIYPRSTGNNGAEDGHNVISKLHDQEEYSAALTRNNMQHIMEPGAVLELLGEENKEIKFKKVLSKTPTSVSYANAPSKGKKNHQRDPQAQKIPQDFSKGQPRRQICQGRDASRGGFFFIKLFNKYLLALKLLLVICWWN